MSSLVQAIISKPKWSEKLKDEVIREKWRKEFLDQGADENVVKIVFNVLGHYFEPPEKRNRYEELEKYNWFISLTFSHLSIFPEKSCSCECLVCTDRDNEMDSDYESEEDEDDEDEDEEEDGSEPKAKREKPEKITECSCIDRFAGYRLQFLKKYAVEYHGLIDARVATEFRRLISLLPKDRFHPGTENMTVDVIHPSIHPYVKGATQVLGDAKVDSNVLFQWLPAEVSLDESDNVTFLSYINNLPVANTELYSSIGAVLKKFIHPFRQCLSALAESGQIKSVPSLERCQVIVKAQEIHLTPEQPEFKEGSWHLEGTAHERIIATGIYYYEMDNVQDSSLAFKVKLHEDEYIPYPQDGVLYMENHYCLDRGSHSSGRRDFTKTINLGEIPTVQDLCLVFPNVFQHKVSRVALRDMSRPGARKILVFWLIDPAQPILSTASVPQQSFPAEVAQQYQELLMHDRQYYVGKQNEIFERTFSLCEH